MDRKIIIIIMVAAIAAVAGGFVGSGLTIWWNATGASPYAGSRIYDSCLASNNGNRVACDAMMRVMARDQQDEAWKADLTKQARKLSAAGFGKKEVAQWALDQGFATRFAPVDLTHIIDGLTVDDLIEMAKEKSH